MNSRASRFSHIKALRRHIYINISSYSASVVALRAPLETAVHGNMSSELKLLYKVSFSFTFALQFID